MSSGRRLVTLVGAVRFASAGQLEMLVAFNAWTAVAAKLQASAERIVSLRNIVSFA